MLVKKVPIGTCKCKCGQAVYECHYQDQDGRVRVRQYEWVRGHMLKDSFPLSAEETWVRRREWREAKPVYKKLLAYKQKKELTWRQLEEMLELPRGYLWRFKDRKWIQLSIVEKIEELTADEPDAPEPGIIPAAPIYQLMKDYRERYDLTWPQLGKILGYKARFDHYFRRRETIMRLTADKIREKLSQPPDLQPKYVPAQPIADVLNKYKAANGLTWKQLAQMLGYKRDSNVRNLLKQERISRDIAEKILATLADLRGLPRKPTRLEAEARDARNKGIKQAFKELDLHARAS
jgi:cyanate lyase